MKFDLSKQTVEKFRLFKNMVIRSENNYHKIIEIPFISRNKVSDETLERINKFYLTLDFRFKVIIRTVNNNIEEKYKKFKQNLENNAKERHDKRLLDEVYRYCVYVENNVLKRASRQTKIYIDIPLITQHTKLSPEQAYETLTERERTVIEHFEMITKHNISPLKPEDVQNLLESYKNDFVIYTDVYSAPLDWLQDFITRANKKENYYKPVNIGSDKAKSLLQVVDTIKRHARLKRELFFSECKGLFDEITKKEKLFVLGELSRDRDFLIVDNEVIRYLPDIKIKEHILYSLISKPKFFSLSPNVLIHDDMQYSGYTGIGYPSNLTQGMLSSVLSHMENISMMLDIMPASNLQVYLHLKTKLAHLNKEIAKLYDNGYGADELEKEKSSLLNKISGIESGKYSFFSISLFLMVEALNDEKSNLILQGLFDNLKINGIHTIPTLNFQKPLYDSLMPGTDVQLPTRSIITTNLVLNRFNFFIKT